ncbi:MAG: hypothetical protein U9R16_03995 [Campylobacterota bacterium]|nr:hypothetical protein [Campylobacterota bacterium]
MKNNKPAFVLITTMFLVVLFGIYSLTIMENNTFSSNLNRLKYLHLQANIHIDYVKEFIENSTDIQIDNFSLNDDRYKMKIVNKAGENYSTKYYISIETKDDTPVRLSQIIIK